MSYQFSRFWLILNAPVRRCRIFLKSCHTTETIIGRTRKDGSTAFTDQVVIKKDGAIVYREAETFSRKQTANAWIVKREAGLKRPGGFDRKHDLR
jgi:hypothetical protein